MAIKVIRNKQTGQSEGYGFVEFYSHAAAEKVLEGFSGHIMPNTDQPFRLNWASFSMGDRRSDVASDHSIFVGDLASDVNDATLLEAFSSRYSSVKGAKVVIDANTGRSKGYGFVRFGDDSEKTHAMTEMNGVYCSSRPMRIGPATPRKSSGSVHSIHLLYLLAFVLLSSWLCYFTNPCLCSIQVYAVRFLCFLYNPLYFKTRQSISDLFIYWFQCSFGESIAILCHFSYDSSCI